MADWKGIAKARGLDLPPPDLDRVADALDRLQQTFGPLAKQLTFEVEPATTLHIFEEDQ